MLRSMAGLSRLSHISFSGVFAQRASELAPHINHIPSALGFSRTHTRSVSLTHDPPAQSADVPASSEPRERRRGAMRTGKLQETATEKVVQKRKCTAKVSTLDPTRLVRSDHYELSHWSENQYFRLGSSGKVEALDMRKINHLTTKDEEGCTGGEYRRYTLNGDDLGCVHRFPAGTRGFFYYWTPPSPYPAFAGELRFRVTESDDPATFQDGHDLRCYHGYHWRKPLHSLAMTLYGKPILAQLLSEGLVDHKTVFGWTQRGQLKANVPFLHSLGQPFSMHLDASFVIFGVVSATDTGNVCVQGVFTDTREKQDGPSTPYTGTILVCFERSTLPVHANNRTLVLRVLGIEKEIHCVIPGYDGYAPRPVVGELVRSATRHDGPWTVDVDGKSKSHRALQLLFDTSGR